MPSFLSNIDWQRPWLAPLLPAATPILQASDWRAALNAAALGGGLRNRRGLPIRFVPQSELALDMAYESFIDSTGAVPTRDNLHDFFNALVWLTFPGIKAQLNRLQAAEISRCLGPELSRRRGSVRDAATIFDESAALLVVRDDALADALRQHRWHDAFVTRRASFQRDSEVWLFGHALMEKLVSPYKSITAHAWLISAAPAFFEMSSQQKCRWMDIQVAGQLSHELATSNFTPLPLAGVPGWWEYQDAAFYADETVFRPKRKTMRQ